MKSLPEIMPILETLQNRETAKLANLLASQRALQNQIDGLRILVSKQAEIAVGGSDMALGAATQSREKWYQLMQSKIRDKNTELALLAADTERQKVHAMRAISRAQALKAVMLKSKIRRSAWREEP